MEGCCSSDPVLRHVFQAGSQGAQTDGFPEASSSRDGDGTTRPTENAIDLSRDTRPQIGDRTCSGECRSNISRLFTVVAQVPALSSLARDFFSRDVANLEV